MKNRQAFTLIELLITLVIVGVVIAIGVPAINRVRNDSEVETMRARAVLLQNAKLSFIDAVGTQTASTSWRSRNDQQRYQELLMPYLPNTMTPTLSVLIKAPFAVNLGTNLSLPVAFTAPNSAQGGRAVKTPLEKY